MSIPPDGAASGPPASSADDSGLLDGDQTAIDRDRTADSHDESAEARDLRSAARDERAAARDDRDGRVDVEAASDRAGAKRDRLGAQGDRKHAADDREAAGVDRELAAERVSSLVFDELTGAYVRGAGVQELEREIVQARRTGETFVLAFVDVDGLKEVNDGRGHQAGDTLLVDVADAIRGVVRDYDVVVRFGGDEFICGQLGVTLAGAVERFAGINLSLSKSAGGAVSVGVVELAAGEELEDLISRGDQTMYANKRQSHAQSRSDRTPA
ncbi:MAG: GGDEF domain-containing protein [Actinomycetota bacterium]|nr:GGDEF domain-containing protein [Actinomycetota bacterium]